MSRQEIESGDPLDLIAAEDSASDAVATNGTGTASAQTVAARPAARPEGSRSLIARLNAKTDAENAADVAANSDRNLAEAGIVGIGVQDFIRNEPPPFEWIIENLIAEHFKGDLFGKSKIGKTFFCLDEAVCVTKGCDWLGFHVPKPRRVLYVNCELPERALWERLRAIMKAHDALDVPNEMLTVYNVRGKGRVLRDHEEELVAEVKRRGVEFVILDPRYKLLRDEEDENSMQGLRGFLDFRDALSSVAAVQTICHDPKGSTFGKSVTDRGAGSYAAGADCDYALALSPHAMEEQGYSRLSFVSRCRKTPEPLSIKFDETTFSFVADADVPATEKKPVMLGGSNKIEKVEAGEALTPFVIEALKLEREQDERDGVPHDGVKSGDLVVATKRRVVAAGKRPPRDAEVSSWLGKLAKRKIISARKCKHLAGQPILYSLPVTNGLLFSENNPETNNL